MRYHSSQHLHSNWEHAPGAVSLSPGEAHVWRASLEQPGERTARLSGLLSPSERARAERFQFEHLRLDYTVVHGILRILLAMYLDTKPEDIAYSYSEKGKPSLAEESAKLDIGFSLSDSRALALYAFALHPNVGVDVEAVRPLSRRKSLAESAFTPGECALLQKLPEEEQEAAFFQAWTVKEAALKAGGEGLRGLKRVECLLGADENGADYGVREVRDARAASWTAHLLDPSPGYAAALTIPEAGWACRTFAFNLE
jgi:4'-phosphopantetheinyl transferase